MNSSDYYNNKWLTRIKCRPRLAQAALSLASGCAPVSLSVYIYMSNMQESVLLYFHFKHFRIIHVTYVKLTWSSDTFKQLIIIKSGASLFLSLSVVCKSANLSLSLSLSILVIWFVPSLSLFDWNWFPYIIFHL